MLYIDVTSQTRKIIHSLLGVHEMPPVCQEKAQLMSIIGGGGDDNDVTPEITRCATCTKPNAPNRCSKCKVYKYCEHDCQAKQHWMKGGHKQRCNKAEENSQNGGKAIARGFIQNDTADPLVQNFFSYFDSVAKLGALWDSSVLV